MISIQATPNRCPTTMLVPWILTLLFTAAAEPVQVPPGLQRPVLAKRDRAHQLYVPRLAL